MVKIELTKEEAVVLKRAISSRLDRIDYLLNRYMKEGNPVAVGIYDRQADDLHEVSNKVDDAINKAGG